MGLGFMRTNNNSHGEFHPNICIQISLRKRQDKIDGLGVQTVDVA